eukprot:9676584-Karenia_brevis.AAC.1
MSHRSGTRAGFGSDREANLLDPPKYPRGLTLDRYISRCRRSLVQLSPHLLHPPPRQHPDVATRKYHYGAGALA